MHVYTIYNMVLAWLRTAQTYATREPPLSESDSEFIDLFHLTQQEAGIDSVN